MFTATVSHLLIDPVDGTTVDATVETVEPIDASQAAALHRAQVQTWKQLGYFVREGDGWATGVAADAKASLIVGRLTPAEVEALEAAEAAGEAQWDAHVNA